MGKMLLPLQLFSSIKLKVLRVGVVILLPPLTINFISDVTVSNRALHDFIFGINYHDAILQNLHV